MKTISFVCFLARIVELRSFPLRQVKGNKFISGSQRFRHDYYSLTSAAFFKNDSCSHLFSTSTSSKIEDVYAVNVLEDNEIDLDLKYVKPRPQRLQTGLKILVKDCTLLTILENVQRSFNNYHILGLDINTVSTGYAVLRVGLNRTQLCECGRICTKQAEDVLDGGSGIEMHLRDLRERYGGLSHWLIGIEDFAKSFKAGHFQTKGLFKLAQLNGIVKYNCLKTFGTKAGTWHATSIRSFYSLNKLKGDVEDVKQTVFNYVLRREYGQNPAEIPITNLGGFEFIYGVRNGILSKDNYDVTDAYLIALYAWHQAIIEALKSNAVLREQFSEAYFNHFPEEEVLFEESENCKPRSKMNKERLLKAEMSRQKINVLFYEALDVWGRDTLSGLSFDAVKENKSKLD